MSTSTPHYPSTAELAAFRRSLAAGPDTDARAFPPHLPIHRNGEDGAWSWEREHGMGYRAREGHAPEYVTTAPGDPWDGYHVVMCANDADRVYATRARREASALRSRAYDGSECGACGEPSPMCPGCYVGNPSLCGEAMSDGARCYHAAFAEHSHNDEPRPAFIR